MDGTNIVPNVNLPSQVRTGPVKTNSKEGACIVDRICSSEALLDQTAIIGILDNKTWMINPPSYILQYRKQ